MNGRRLTEGTSAHARDVAIAAAHVGAGQAQGAMGWSCSPGMGERSLKGNFHGTLPLTSLKLPLTQVYELCSDP